MLYRLAKTLPVFLEIGFHTLKLLVNRVVTTGTTLTWEGGVESTYHFNNVNIYFILMKTATVEMEC